MAKQTKTIKCPQCGSIKKTETGKDTYKCNDCGSSYFLDSDDVNINIYEQQKTTPPRYTNNRPPKNNIKMFGIIFVVAMSIFTVFILPRIIISSHENGGTFASGSGYSARNYRICESMLIDDPTSNNPMVFIIDERDNDGYYAVLYDLKKKKIVTEKKLKNESRKSASYGIRKCFDAWYIQERADEAYIVYKVDPANFVFENLGDKLAMEFPELSAGIATIKIEHYIEAFELLTNDGEEYCYSAYANKLYKDDRAVINDKSIPTHTTYYYGFTDGRSTHCKKMDKVQLVQLKSVSQNRILKDYSLKWGYQCKFEAQWFNGDYTFIKDVTPDRKYFGGGGNSVINNDKPKVLFWNNEAVFVLLKASANPAATYNIQSIDVATGNLNWSIETSWQEEVRIGDFEEYKDFYVMNMRIKGTQYFFTIDKNNPSLESINLPQYR